jgi:hypothetical protein
MDVAEELKLIYKFKWGKKIATLESRDWSSQGKHDRELGLRQN